MRRTAYVAICLVAAAAAAARTRTACAQAPAISSANDSTIRSFGGGVYLFHYRPIDLSGAVANTEVYAAYLTADERRGRWHLYGEGRARDSKLRPWFNGNVWVQQVWLSYDVAPSTEGSLVTLRGGKIYQTVGRFWDGSFFGNIQYFDGLKLNPQFGAEAAGVWHPGGGADLSYTAQYIANSDRVSGALAARDFETLSGFRDRDGYSARGVAAFPLGETRLALGVSGFSRGVADSSGRSFHAPHVAVDGDWSAGPASLYAEWTHRADGSVPLPLRATMAGSRAEYWLAGAQWNQGIVHLRYNFSRARYDDLDRLDWIHQPGVTVDLAPELHAFVELDLWRTRAAEAISSRIVTSDRSLDVVVQLVVP